jgi:hypothetical protein
MSFHGSHQNIPNQRIEKIHEIFFRAPFSRDISIDTIASSLGLPRQEAINILKEMVSEKVVEWEPFRCDGCGRTISELHPYCICGHDLGDQISFHVEGCIDRQKQRDFLVFPNGKAQAARFAHLLNIQGHMYYLLIDLAESENLQEEDNFYYNEFLKKVRELIRLEVLSQAKDYVQCFGEIGDCMKIAFLSADDIITAVEKFAEIIKRENFDNQFPTLKGKETVFPRFDGTVGKVTVSNRNSESMINLKLDNNELEKTFCITLNGSIDFNDYELTQLFRFDHAIKTKKSIFEDYIITLWLQQEILDDLEWDTVKTMAIETTSHGIPKKRKFGLVGFTGRSDESYKTVDNPQEYLVNKNTS